MYAPGVRQGFMERSLTGRYQYQKSPVSGRKLWSRRCVAGVCMPSFFLCTSLFLRTGVVAWFPLGSSSDGKVRVLEIMAPVPRSQAEAAHRVAVDAAISRFWEGAVVDDLTCAEEIAIDQARPSCSKAMLEPGRRPSRYGEVTPIGVRQLGRAMGLDDPSCGDVVFADLGSGVGKFVVQSYLEWPSVGRAFGIELSPTRARIGQSCWASLHASGEAKGLRQSALASAAVEQQAIDQLCTAVALFEGDLFAADLRETTHIYVASLCFDDVMLCRLAEKLSTEAPRLRTIATLRRFPKGVVGFEQTSMLDVQMSWTVVGGGGATTYLYKRSGATH